MAGAVRSFLAQNRGQLTGAGVPEHLWEGLCTKLQHQVLDGHRFFDVVAGENGLPEVVCSAEDGLSVENPAGIFLIDHVWTFEAEGAQAQLQQLPELLRRVAAMVLPAGEVDEDKFPSNAAGVHVVAGRAMDRVWGYTQSFQVADQTGQGQKTMWYLMDEFGSAIRHSNSPNMRTAPFIHQTAASVSIYTLAWPIKDFAHGDKATRDFIPAVKNEKEREINLVAFVEGAPISPGDPAAALTKLSSGDKWLSQHLACTSVSDREAEDLDPSQRYKVYTDLPLVRQKLTHPSCTLVDDPAKAEILWLATHFEDFGSLTTKNIYVNQFPNEAIVTCKDLLPAIMRASPEPFPSYLPETFDLVTEAPQFVTEYRRRASQGLDNSWIVKPWNMARSMRHVITTSLPRIIRLRESGPVVAQKYLHDPVLYEGNRKFDLRFMVLVQSICPLHLYVHHVFLLRLANEEFALNSFDTYEKHFTVMNYRPGAQLTQISCADFEKGFDGLYNEQGHSWEQTRTSISEAMAQLFERASTADTSARLTHHPNCRGSYGIDVMLQWADSDHKQMVPQILEVNFSPDCTRVCLAQEDFFNDAFDTLFFGSPKNVYKVR